MVCSIASAPCAVHVSVMRRAINLAPDAPCECRSGLSYGQCHKPIFDAPDDEMLPVAWGLYAEAWATNADHYRSQGVYANLANQLANAVEIGRVLDIGCGRGHGLAALRDALQPGARIIGVDENPECLAAAAERLDVVALPQNIRRAQNQILANGYHLSTYATGSLIDQGLVTLVQSDVIMQDGALERLLNAVGPFDAVSLWFSGVHKARSATEIGRRFKIKDDADHRALVEDRALTVAGERLRPGGVLHLVMRVGAIDIEAVCDEMAQTYNAWLANEPFVLETLNAIPYREPDGGVRVRSADAEVNAMPGYAISMMMRRQG